MMEKFSFTNADINQLSSILNETYDPFILFEALEKGTLTLKTELTTSYRASRANL